MFRFLIILLAFLSIVGLTIWIYPYVAVRTSSLLIMNVEESYDMPKEFRITPLGASASSQFSGEGLKKLLTTLDKPQVIIVDLREESHGFLNGNAVSWYSFHNWINLGEDRDSVIQDEKQRINDLAKNAFKFVFKHKQYPFPVLVRSVQTEEELAYSLNADYYRLPISDHVKPSDKTVDEFVEFIKHLPKESWLHFHCSAGKGRTSTMLTMLDMMQRPHEFSFDQFINRQVLFGGINLLEANPEKDWKLSYLRARAHYLEVFLRYCKEQSPSFEQPWSVWKRIHEN